MGVHGVGCPCCDAERLEDAVPARGREIEYRQLRSVRIDQSECGFTGRVWRSIRRGLVQEGERCS